MIEPRTCDASTDDRHPLSGVRRSSDGQAFAGVHFQVSHEPFELVDGDRLIFNAAAAHVFTRMRADATAGEQKGVALTNGVYRAFIVAFFDLANVARNIDLGRACLLAGCQRIVFLVKMEQALRHGADPDNILGTGLFAGAAPHALGLIHDRETVWSHMNSIEFTRRDAVALTQAANAADPLAAVKRGQGLAAVHPVIKKLVVGALTAGAFVFGHQGFRAPGIDAHHAGHGHGRFHPGHDTDAGGSLTIDHRHGGRRATGIAASTAIGTGEKVFYFRDARALGQTTVEKIALVR